MGVEALPGRFFELFKRSVDVAAALCGMVVLGPLVLACGLWIHMLDRGPILFRQWRVGRDGWLFRVYKLRTMRLDAERESGPRFASDKDPRVLPGCGWMRRSHVDELPQLWNILVGQMSLIGPRPERPEMIEQLKQDLPNIEQRLAGAPGLSGLAQIRSGYSNDLAGAQRKLAYDLLYLRNRSTWNELKLLLSSLPKFWDRGAL